MDLTGQHILITGGTPREIIDGVRYYANHARPEHQGREAAKLLAAQGAKVTLVAPDQAIVSARDLMESAKHYANQDIKAVLHLANISSIRPAHISAQKLKVKKEAGHTVPMEVVGNIDAWQQLETAFSGIPVIGYRHNRLMASIRNPLAESLMPLIEEACRGISSPSPTGGGPGWGHNDTRSKNAPHLTSPLRGEELLSRKIIVTSGPTAERLTTLGDVITNISSGKQGGAIAEALSAMGVEVTLITGGTARDMYIKVMASLPADAYIGVAAVADFGIESPVELRLKEGEPYTLQLVQNPDIVKIVGTHPALRPKVVIGFAAETDGQKLVEYATGKLESKGADVIIANDAGMAGGDANRITWVSKDGAEPWDMMDKYEIGRKIGEKLAEMLGSGTMSS